MNITKQELDAALVLEIESGGNTKPGEAITESLSSGVPVTINAPGGTPVGIGEFEGKTVINRAPLFGSGLWESPFGGKYATNSPSKVTLTADADHQYFTVDVDVKANTDYTLSAKHNGKIGTSDSSGGITLAPFVTDQQITFNSGSYTQIKVIISNIGLGNGTFTFEDVMLNEGTTAQEFVANVKGVTNPTIENTTTGDAITVVGTFHTGDIVDVENKKVTRAKREIVLEGSLGWTYSGATATSKQIFLDFNDVSVNGSEKLVKYNGKLLENRFPNNSDGGSDNFRIHLDLKKLSIMIANTDSGWGQNYTPTQAEIQAYFKGWRMYDGSANGNPYNGTGVKGWFKINKISDFTTTLPTESYMEWNPYRLLYDLATPITESIETIGSLRLASGDNTVELTEGRIVRERASVGKNVNNYYGINSISGYTPTSPLKLKTAQILKVYRNGEEDASWTISTGSTGSWYGTGNATIPASYYDPTAIYTVDYIPLEPYNVSATALPIDINYRDTIGGVTEELVEGVASLESRVSGQQSVLNTSLVKIGETRDDLTATREELLAAIAEGGGGGGGNYELISTVDATLFQSSIAFNTTTDYARYRVILKDVGHNSGSNLGLTLMVNGIFQTGAYNGHKLLSTTISAISSNGINPSTFNSAKDITGVLDVEHTPSGYTTIEGFTIARITSSDAIDVNAEFHRGMLRMKVAGLTSIVIGWTPASAVFNKGTIELWGVPK